MNTEEQLTCTSPMAGCSADEPAAAGIAGADDATGYATALWDAVRAGVAEGAGAGFPPVVEDPRWTFIRGWPRKV